MENSLPFATLSHYRILSRLGAGGMGEVFLAEDQRLGRRVAIKLLSATFNNDTERVRRFLLEAKAASALNHPHIITIHDIGECDAGRYLVMEAVDGRTLREILAEGCSMADLLTLGGQMAKGLAAAHAAGITHRDIKPENIMVRKDGYLKLLDFGLARLSAEVDNLTEPGALLGTLKYMSPEQARGEKATPASDVYALGIVFFEMATGQYPYQATSFAAVLHSILSVPAGEPAALNPLVSAELNMLISRMLSKDSARRPAAAEVARVLEQEGGGSSTGNVAAVVVDGRTVGRGKETEELRTALESVAAGKGLMVCVTGEPGIGKSTFVDAFLRGAAAGGNCTVARGQCSERLAGTDAYLPLLGALESMAELAHVMQEVAPSWHAQLTTASSSSGPAVSQERLKRELEAFFAAAARVRPLLLYIDDLHWADVSTVDLLTYLANQFSSLRILIIVTYRPSEMLLGRHPFLRVKADLQARGALRELQLSFLSVAEIAQYLRVAYPSHQFPEEFAHLIHAKTEGSPLFMADLTRYLRDRGVISADGRLDRDIREIGRDLPESVRGMIACKIGQLAEDDRKLLSVASVQGYVFDSAVAARILGLAPDVVEERLEALERVFLFVRMTGESEFPNRELTVRYQFVHVLYQNALFRALRATQRMTLSRDVALALEGLWGPKRNAAANELAVLWEQAREPEQAAKYYAIAARQAGQLFADAEAAELASRGLAALEQAPESAERTSQELILQVVLGVALRSTRGFADPEVGKAFGRARELCPAAGRTLRMVPVLRGLWEFFEVQASYSDSLTYGRDLLALAEQLDDDSVRVVACDVMGDTSVWMGEFAEGRRHLEKGIGLYDAEKHRPHLFLYGYDTGMACASYLAIALWNLGFADQAAARMAQSLAIAERVNHPLTTAFVGIMAGWLRRLSGDMAGALSGAELAVRVSRENGLQYFLGYGQITRGWALVGLGRVDEGIREIEAGLSLYRSTGAELAVSLWMGCLAEGYASAGRVEEALGVLADALAFVGRTGERVYEAELLRMRGALTGNPADFKAALETARRQGAKHLELRAAISLGDRELVEQLFNGFTEGFDSADLRNAAAALGR